MTNHILSILEAASVDGSFQLSSGESSDWYIDCRKLIGNRVNLRLLVEPLLRYAHQLEANVLAGPASAAIGLMAGALGVGGTVYGVDNFVYTRTKKGHGLELAVEGPPLFKQDKILLVDDVITTGKSLLSCKAALQTEYPEVEIVGAWSVVLRDSANLAELSKQFGSIKYIATEEKIKAYKGNNVHT